MERVDYQHLCPICDHPDGCLYALDGNAAICSRIQEGSIKTVGEGPFSGGYLHILKPGEFKPKPVRKKRPININWDILNQCYIGAFGATCPDSVDKPFDVTLSSLYLLETGQDEEAYTFPTRNSDDQIIGISRRFPDGRKNMVKGSQVGIFIPRLDWTNLETLFICEGASDTATALDMSLKAIGRANCQTGKDHIIKFCIKKRPQRIVIIADNSPIEIKGAKTLGIDISHGYKLFTVTCPDIKIIVPPTGVKDLREWRENGLDLEELRVIVENNLDFDS